MTQRDLLEVRITSEQSTDRMIKKFMRMWRSSDVKEELNRRRSFMTKSERRRVKASSAKFRKDQG